MAYVIGRKNFDNEILLLLPIPLHTSSHVYYEEDLEEMGLGRVLDGYPEAVRSSILEQAGILARIRPELAFHFLLNFPTLLQKIGLEDLKKWVDISLDIYDKGGLNPALEFILQIENHPLFPYHWGKGVSFRDISGILTHYLRGLGREDIGLKEAKSLYTDITTIYVPDRISLFSHKDDNFLLYKGMVTYKFAQMKLCTFFLDANRLLSLDQVLKERYHRISPPEETSCLCRFFNLFPEPALAEDLFILADATRVEKWMSSEFPGLFRSLQRLKMELGLRRKRMQTDSRRSEVVEVLISRHLSGNNGTTEETGIESGGPCSKRRLPPQEAFSPQMTPSAATMGWSGRSKGSLNEYGPHACCSAGKGKGMRWTWMPPWRLTMIVLQASIPRIGSLSGRCGTRGA